MRATPPARGRCDEHVADGIRLVRHDDRRHDRRNDERRRQLRRHTGPGVALLCLQRHPLAELTDVLYVQFHDVDGDGIPQVWIVDDMWDPLRELQTVSLTAWSIDDAGVMQSQVEQTVTASRTSSSMSTAMVDSISSSRIGPNRVTCTGFPVPPTAPSSRARPRCRGRGPRSDSLVRARRGATPMATASPTCSSTPTRSSAC